MRKLLCTLTLAALMAGAASGAQAREGWYIRGDVGYSVDGEINTSFEIEDEDLVASSKATGPQALIISQSFDLDDDWMGDVGAGYNYGNGFRLEGELAYRHNGIESSPFAGAEATSLMLNGFFDFNRDGAFQPYVGVGVGHASLEIQNSRESDWAWQAMAGVGIPLDDNVTLDVAYRFFSIEDLNFGSTDVEYEHQAVTVGLRYQFGAPAAVATTPPPEPTTPPPAVCPTSEFTVYFEWDRSNLNAEAVQVIDRAVARAAECNVNAIAIVGHTDTSGSQAYNVGLSDRRANVVRDALVARGLSASMMTTHARGETELARQTADGVREPLNRRTAVTITFR
jgi:outer membrane protein OmpA-like peptidoglycan-associated protein